MTINDLSLGLAAEQRHIVWDEDADSTVHLVGEEYAHVECASSGGRPVVIEGSHKVAAVPEGRVFQCPQVWCGTVVSIGDDEGDAWAELWGHVHTEHNRNGLGSVTDSMMAVVQERTLRELYG